MIYNKLYNTRPVMAHAPGKLEYNPLWAELLNLANIGIKTKLPDGISIVTFNNGSKIGHNSKPMGIFEKSLRGSGVPCSVLGAGVINWKNNFKIDLLLEHLNQVRTDYVLVADSSDVVLSNKLESLLDLFESFNCDAVFNAEKIMWPTLPKRLADFELKLNKAGFLNAGLWMARTNFAKEFLLACKSANVPSYHVNSEQIYFKHTYPSYYPRVQVDYNCKIFQGLNRVDASEVEFTRMF